MQILETQLARIAFFADVRLLNPQGLSLRPIHSGLLERYKFLIYPTAPTEFDLTKGIRYSDGEFAYERKPIAVSFTIYNNGWLVETLVSTEAAEAFWNDIAEWLIGIGFRSPKDVVTKTVYESQLVVQAQLDIVKSFDKLQGCAKFISELSGNPREELSGFYIGTETEQLSTFTFERRIGVPFSENKYFSRATLPTGKHVHALEEIEKILR